ncbi:MAG: hypothetical protein AVDCRST_MAG83-172 [uncultured Arthrobacter sp.]|uniref:Uncharacterized protein n=1 Tax=uncultured Arthrobacter sp. TaxID=114050 RepID=A0A6J4H2Y0_9MICC|nr:MAG: hypothetical protein AVDCRST_MAG83-172 [uncultured Arthrobacter sp.]
MDSAPGCGHPEFEVGRGGPGRGRVRPPRAVRNGCAFRRHGRPLRPPAEAPVDGERLRRQRPGRAAENPCRK